MRRILLLTEWQCDNFILQNGAFRGSVELLQSLLLKLALLKKEVTF